MPLLTGFRTKCTYPLPKFIKETPKDYFIKVLKAKYISYPSLHYSKILFNGSIWVTLASFLSKFSEVTLISKSWLSSSIYWLSFSESSITKAKNYLWVSV